jgi:SAM-dependent methyltransferase
MGQDRRDVEEADRTDGDGASMILSRVMRKEDYLELVDEQRVMQFIRDSIQMWYPPQHQHRVWEYAMALKAFWTVFGTGKKDLLVTDHGCGAGFLSPMMYWLGQNVWMYECWTMGSAEEYMLEQMRRVGLNRKEKHGTYQMRSAPLCQLTDEDRGVDAAFCISTLEHIGEYQKAFRDLLSTVKSGGLVFLTTDFGEHEEDTYQYAGLRAGKMFCEKTYLELWEIAIAMGFEMIDKTPKEKDDWVDWEWKEENRLVLDYGFASLAMIRMPEKEKNERTMVAR